MEISLVNIYDMKNINVCLFIFFQLKTIFINKNKSDNSVTNPAHPERVNQRKI